MKLKDLDSFSRDFSSSPKFPILFMGHGSPMNALEENEFVQGWKYLGKSLPKPKAILCISAHWETRGTFITAMENPPTIHDFGGFPQSLFEVQYPAFGSPELAHEIKKHISIADIGLDLHWGLDHGAWSVIRHLYPMADIPILEFSLDYTLDPQGHYQLAKELSFLRDRGVLILASGNMVHNLARIQWNMPDQGYDWAEWANLKMKEWIISGDFSSLIQYNKAGREIQMAIPSPEHFLPLIYLLGMKDAEEPMEFINEKVVWGSISMTSLKIG